MRPAICRINSERGFVSGSRFDLSAAILMQIAQIQPCRNVSGVKGQCLFKFNLCIFATIQMIHKNSGTIDMHLFWLGHSKCESPLICIERRVKLPKAAVQIAEIEPVVCVVRPYRD